MLQKATVFDAMASAGEAATTIPAPAVASAIAGSMTLRTSLARRTVEFFMTCHIPACVDPLPTPRTNVTHPAAQIDGPFG
jgi:hypothetical protein